MCYQGGKALRRYLQETNNLRGGALSKFQETKAQQELSQFRGMRMSHGWNKATEIQRQVRSQAEKEGPQQRRNWTNILSWWASLQGWSWHPSRNLNTDRIPKAVVPASEVVLGFTLFLKQPPSYFKTSENKSQALPGDKLSHRNQSVFIPKACSTDPTPPLMTNNNDPQQQALTAQSKLAFNSWSSTSAFQVPRFQPCITWPSACWSVSLTPSYSGHEGTLAISYIVHPWHFCSYKEIFLFFLPLKSNSHLLDVSLISVTLMSFFEPKV